MRMMCCNDVLFGITYLQIVTWHIIFFMIYDSLLQYVVIAFTAGLK